MDTVSAKVLGTGAIVFGLIFIVTSIARFTRPDLDVLLVILNIVFGALLLYTGSRLWRSALRGANRDR
jgi:threonine/homoserine/homoserine lactone efflux protein